MYDTLLFLHVLGAFLLVAMLGVFWAMYLAGAPEWIAPLGNLAFPLWGGAHRGIVYDRWGVRG